jgi:outer membrane protein TolC
MPGYAKSLNDTVRCALKHASSIKQSRNEAIIARINRDKNRVEQFGEINLAADYTHYNSSRTLGPLTPSIMKSGIPIPETTNLYSIGVSYSVPLFTGFAHMRQLEISSLAKEMAKVKVDLKKLQSALKGALVDAGKKELSKRAGKEIDKQVDHFLEGEDQQEIKKKTKGLLKKFF